jgi:hypothetical protein
VTMRNLDVPTDPDDYITGPTGNQTSRTNGGTNRSGGVSVVEVSEEATTIRTAGDEQTTPAPPNTSAGGTGQ